LQRISIFLFYARYLLRFLQFASIHQKIRKKFALLAVARPFMFRYNRNSDMEEQAAVMDNKQICSLRADNF